MPERNDANSFDSKVPDCSEGGHHSLGLRDTLDNLVLWEQR